VEVPAGGVTVWTRGSVGSLEERGAELEGRGLAWSRWIARRRVPSWMSSPCRIGLRIEMICR